MGAPDASNNPVSISEATEAIQQTTLRQDQPQDSSPVEVNPGKCCKGGTKCSVLSTFMARYIACLGGMCGVRSTDVECFSACYPQPVDNFVDNYVNMLQNWHLSAN